MAVSSLCLGEEGNKVLQGYIRMIKRAPDPYIFLGQRISQNKSQKDPSHAYFLLFSFIFSVIFPHVLCYKKR